MTERPVGEECRRTDPVKRGRGKKFLRRFSLALIVLLVLYTVLLYFLVSTALVPSFMRKLRLFEDVTRKSYSEQVQDKPVQSNYRAAQTIGEAWGKETPHERLRIRSYDGYLLTAAMYRQTAGHLWVITLHGYTGWKEAMYPNACWYYRNGFSVLAPDLRCQGESEGDFIGMGWTDRQDLLLWIAQILERDPEAEIVLHGQSMGASCALLLSGMEELPRQVKAVVSDCAYTDAMSMFRIKIRDWLHLPAFLFLDGANLMLQLRGGYDLRKASPVTAVENSRIPILYIHGAEDRMISVEMTYELYRNTGSPKELLIVDGAGHTQAMDADPVLYYGKIRQFLGGVIGDF